MIQILFPLIFVEMALILVSVFKTPLRKPVIMGLDLVKRGRGRIVVKTVVATILVVMMATVYNVMVIRRRWIQDGEANPTDRVLYSKHQLEASFMVFLLFLGLMIDRLHHYIRELRIRRKTTEAVKKQNLVSDDFKPAVSDETIALEQEVTALHEKIKQLKIQFEVKSKVTKQLELRLRDQSKEANQLEAKLEEKSKEANQLEAKLEEKSQEASSSEANALALRKQSEGFLLEYDRLLEENQNLRSQLQSLDRRLSFSKSKKVK